MKTGSQVKFVVKIKKKFEVLYKTVKFKIFNLHQIFILSEFFSIFYCVHCIYLFYYRLNLVWLVVLFGVALSAGVPAHLSTLCLNDFLLLPAQYTFWSVQARNVLCIFDKKREILQQTQSEQPPHQDHA